jgi:DNA-binding beta-propeller fold protein YncE
MSTRIVILLAAIVILLIPSRSSAQVVTTYETGLTRAWGIEFDPAGNMYVSCRGGGDSGFVRRIPADGGSATTFAGGFSYPTGMAFAPSGDLFVADLGQDGGGGPGRIWKVTPAGVKTLFFAEDIGLGNPAFLEFDHAGNLLISDRTLAKMWSLSPSGVLSDYGPLLGATGEWAGQFVIEPNGDVCIGVGSFIKRIGPSGSPVTIVASGLGSVQGLARGPRGEFVISRNGASDLWIVSSDGVGSPWAGSTAGCVDGLLADAKFGAPQGLATLDSRLFVADRGCDAVRVIETATPTRPTTWGHVKSTYR